MEVGKGMGVRKIFTGYDNIIIVTSVDKKRSKTIFSNYSYQFVHTTAPGAKVLTTAPDNKYREVSSTSVAAAHVAAAIAYAISEYGGEKTVEDYLTAYNPTQEVENCSFEKNMSQEAILYIYIAFYLL